LRITRFPSLTNDQFLGCVAAFSDALTGELNAAALALRRLEGQAKGSAFAHEMALDARRYGALIVLDRWLALAAAFGAHLQHPIAHAAPERVETAERLIASANQLIDSAASYDPTVVEAALMTFRTVTAAFEEERRAADESAKLGPMLSSDFVSARKIFGEDLAAR
jgi:hypothetical protein